MQSKILASLLASAALLAPALSHAQARALPDGAMVFSPMVGMALTGGGKTLDTVYFTDGSSEKVSSGGLVYLYAGGELRFVGSPVAVQGTIGYHVDDATGNNGGVTFSRVPFELVGMFNLDERFRLGAGVHYDTSVHLSGNGAGSSPDLPRRYDDAAGLVVKAEWMAFREVGFELSFVDVHYKINSVAGSPATGPSVDGSHVGIGFNYHW